MDRAEHSAPSDWKLRHSVTHRRGRIDRREPITFQDREVFVRQSAIAQDRFTFTVVLLTVAPLQVGALANKNGERRRGWGLKARLADFGGGFN